MSSFCRISSQRARKGYVCHGCGHPIPPKCLYTVWRGVWDGDTYYFTLHTPCWGVIQDMLSHSDDGINPEDLSIGEVSDWIRRDSTKTLTDALTYFSDIANAEWVALLTAPMTPSESADVAAGDCGPPF